MNHVLEINELSALREHQLPWNALLPQTRGASFFQSFAWLETYWQHFGAGQRLRVLIVYNDARPIGILPLAVRRDATAVGLLRRLTYPLHGWGGFYGPIGPNPTATLLAGMRHVARSPRDWDLIDLPWIARDRIDRGRTQRSLQQAGMPASELPYEQSAQIDCRQPWEAYWGRLKSHWRTNVRRAISRLNEQGEVRYVRYRPLGALAGEDDPRWDLWRDCLQLAAASWQAESTSGTTLSHGQVRDFLTDVHEVAARSGSLDMNLLYLNEKPVAFAYNYHYDGAVFGLRNGYDAEASRDGAGTVLLHHALRDSMARGDSLYDLGPEYLSSKRQWLTHLEQSYRLLHYPLAAPKAQLVRLRQWMKRWNAGKAAAV